MLPPSERMRCPTSVEKSLLLQTPFGEPLRSSRRGMGAWMDGSRSSRSQRIEPPPAPREKRASSSCSSSRWASLVRRLRSQAAGRLVDTRAKPWTDILSTPTPISLFAWDRLLILPQDSGPPFPQIQRAPRPAKALSREGVTPSPSPHRSQAPPIILARHEWVLGG
jgi:hypothetical protein